MSVVSPLLGFGRDALRVVDGSIFTVSPGTNS